MTDRILAKKMDSDDTRWYEGIVHKVLDKSVHLRFNDRFSPLSGQRYNVRFDLNRLVYRRMHQALSTTFAENRVLFPSQIHLPPCGVSAVPIRPIDRRMQNNEPQKLAVTTITNLPPGSAPFVVFGP